MRLFKRLINHPVGYAMSFYDGALISEIIYNDVGETCIVVTDHISGVTLEEDLTQFTMEEFI